MKRSLGEAFYLFSCPLLGHIAPDQISAKPKRPIWTPHPDNMDEEALKRFMPTSFGGGAGGFDQDAQIEKTRRKGPENEKREEKSSQKDSDGDSDDSDSDEDEDDFPTSHEIVFKTHDRPVTTVTVDASGSRMITGSTDCTIKLHDFATMAPNTLRAFKSVDPSATKDSANVESHPIHVARFNPNAPSRVLVVSATPQARILSRDGEQVMEFNKGDMYLRDMNMTKGHISEITSGTWHPTNPEICVTAGTDSTLRIWDTSIGSRQKDIIVHKSKLAGSAGRSRMTAVAWGSQVDGGNNLLVSAALDGSLSMWGGEGPFSRPSGEIRDAHTADTWTSGLDISSDGRLVITRGGDDTIKLFDTRKFKAPVSTTSHPSTSSQYPTSNIIFAPNSSAILTGSPTGDLNILNPATLRPELITPISPSDPLITLGWHSTLNQIFTGHASGSVHVLFSPRTSQKAALTILSKPPKRTHIDDDPNLTTAADLALTSDAILNPGDVPSSSSAAYPKQTGLTASGKSRDPRRPHIPATTPFAKSQPDQKHIRESIPLSSMREEDPREALLKYADKAAREPMFTNAWKKTQPKTIYADAEEEEDASGGGEDGDGPDRKRVKR
jgi:WD40 repeat protein